VVRNGVSSVDGLNFPDSVTVSSDGRHVYVGGVDNLGIFARDQDSGALQFVESVRSRMGEVDGLDGLLTPTISGDGRHVYIASADGGVAVFARDEDSGALQFVEVLRNGMGGVQGLDGAISVTVSSDGRHVYVAGQFDSALAVFGRDQGSGRLQFVEAVRNGVGGADGLRGAFSVTVSSDGRHVYVASFEDSAVAVFARDQDSGALQFIEAVRNGIRGVDGLDGASTVTVSRDGRNVYVASPSDSAVAVFGRNQDSGALQFVEAVRNGGGGSKGLFGAQSVTVSGDGQYVYVASIADSAVAVFARDQDSGALQFVDVARNDVGGVAGLFIAAWVTVSADGRHVYVASIGDGAIVVFAVNE
jgi:6-phosphogluconolactonase (cycloisomerase 2 family)